MPGDRTERGGMRPRAGRVLETALYCEDLEAAEAFYSGVLGLEVLTRDPGRHVFFRLDDAVFLVFRASSTSTPQPERKGVTMLQHGAVGVGHVAFAATHDEIDEWRAHLEASGIEVEEEVAWPNGGRSIYFRDPCRNVVEFATPQLWGLDDARPPANV